MDLRLEKKLLFLVKMVLRFTFFRKYTIIINGNPRMEGDRNEKKDFSFYRTYFNWCDYWINSRYT